MKTGSRFTEPNGPESKTLGFLSPGVAAQPGTVCRDWLGELPRVLECDEAASTVVVGVDLTYETAGEYDLVAFGSFHRIV